MITTSFDEMTGNGQAVTDAVIILKRGSWFTPKEEVSLRFAIVVGDDFRQGWVIVNSCMEDWVFLGNESVLALVDGSRHKFEGFVETSDTQVSGDFVMCIESFHVPVDEGFIKAVATSSVSKIRLAGSDFELPEGLKVDLQDLVLAI